MRNRNSLFLVVDDLNPFLFPSAGQAVVFQQFDWQEV